MSYGYFWMFILVMIVVMWDGEEQEILNITHNGCKYK
jgi:succinate-acetate transporter protein